MIGHLPGTCSPPPLSGSADLHGLGAQQRRRTGKAPTATATRRQEDPGGGAHGREPLDRTDCMRHTHTGDN